MKYIGVSQSLLINISPNKEAVIEELTTKLDEAKDSIFKLAPLTILDSSNLTELEQITNFLFLNIPK